MKHGFKILILIMFLLAVFGCSPIKNLIGDKPYPGVHTRGDCKNLWDLHYYTTNILKCEHDMESPKFKIGQRVNLLSDQYDKACYGTVIQISFWNVSLNENRYMVNVQCNGLNLYRDEITESHLK